MAGEAIDICLRLLKESNKSRFDSYSVRNNVLSIYHIIFRDCRAHIFCDNLSRNSCKLRYHCAFNPFILSMPRFLGAERIIDLRQP